MSARTIIVVVLALVCGLCAAVGIQGMRKTPAAVAEVAPEPIATEPVIVMLAPVAQGQLIQVADVQVQELPKAFVPPGAFKLAADVVGRRAQISLVKGDTVTDRMLIATGGYNLGPRVPSGWRAFTILTSSPSSSLAGALAKGDRVDVLFTATTQAIPLTVGTRATILLQDVEVLAVNPKDESAATNKIPANEVLSATLLVRIYEAATLDQAQAMGMIHLALRNPGGDRSPSPDELAEFLKSGKRPITIRARNLTAAIAGLLAPDDYVNVRDAMKGDDGGSEPPGLGEIVVEGVRILDIKANVDQSHRGRLYPVDVLTVTLLVDRQQAERLEQVQESGQLGLELRRPGDPVKIAKATAPPLVDDVQQTRTLRGTRYGVDRSTTRPASSAASQRFVTPPIASGPAE